MPIDDLILESKDLANVQSIWHIIYEFQSSTKYIIMKKLILRCLLQNSKG